jgi:hypothetical protein
MELYSHKRTEGISYARIGYYYGAADAIDDHVFITSEDVRKFSLPADRMPEQGFGSANSEFAQIEDLVARKAKIKLARDPLWVGGQMACWTPVGSTDQLEIPFEIKEEGKYVIRLVTARTPDSATVSAQVDGQPAKLSGQDQFDLSVPFRTLSRAIATPVQTLSAGRHVISLSPAAGNRKVGLDFLWIQKR